MSAITWKNRRWAKPNGCWHFAEIIGKRAEGEKVFAEIPVRYNVLKRK